MSVNLGKVSSGPSFKPYIIGFGVVSLIIIGFVIYTTFAKATITLTPKQETSHAETFITVSSDAEGDLTSYNTVSGRIITKNVTATKTYSEVQKKEVDAFAKGTVTLINKRSEAQPLLPRTQLITKDGVIFKTNDWLSIPANGSIEAPVTAAEKGASGNINPDKLIVAKLWEGWQDIIYAETTDGFSGGVLNDYVITQQEIENAKQSAIKQIAAEEIEKFSSEISDEEYADPKLAHAEISNLSTSAKIDDIAESFEVTVTAKIKIIIPNKSQLQTVAEGNLRKNLEKNKEIIDFDLNTTEFSVDSISEDTSSATIKANIKAETINNIPDSAREKETLYGRNYQDVISYYKRFHEISRTEISFSPPWVSRVPSNNNNIEIIIDTN